MLRQVYEKSSTRFATSPGKPVVNHFRAYAISLALIFLLGGIATWYTSTQTVEAASASLDRINVAAAANGGTVSASSEGSLDDYPAKSVIDGDRTGLNWGAGGGWADATSSVFPDWIAVDFEEAATIDEIDVVTLQDAWWNPSEPTESLVFYNNGITSFDVQYWDGHGWANVPGGSVTGNNEVWRKFTFSPITTDRIRVLVKAAKAKNSIIVELEAYGVPPIPDPSPTPTPTPSPAPGGVEAALAAREIYFDSNDNVGFGTTLPIFNDDGTTGAFVGKWVAIDGKLPGAAAYLGLGGTVPAPGDRVGVLNFYNMAMGGVDHRTAAIYSFNGSRLGAGNLEFYTAPDFIGPVRRMQIAPSGEIGINHAAGPGTMLEIMSKTADANSKGLVVLDSSDRSVLTVRSDGQISADRPGQGIVLKSPNGLVCAKLSIDNSGSLVVSPIPCP